ncbi:MAG: hypothetical protein R6V85_19955 [Polyangia bacterium]
MSPMQSDPKRSRLERLIATTSVLAAMSLLCSACGSAPIVASTRTTPAGTWETRPSASLVANAQVLQPDHLDFVPSFSLSHGLSSTADVGLRAFPGGGTLGFGKRFDLGPVELALRPELGVQVVAVCHSDMCGSPHPAALVELPVLLGARLGSCRVVAGPHLRLLYSNMNGELLSNAARAWLELGPAVIPGAVVGLEYGMKSGAHLLFSLQGHRLEGWTGWGPEPAYILQTTVTISFEP